MTRGRDRDPSPGRRPSYPAACVAHLVCGRQLPRWYGPPRPRSTTGGIR